MTLLLTVAGCDKPATVAVPEKQKSAPTPPAAPPIPPAKPFQIVEKDDLFDYSFGYPAEVAAIPALAKKLGNEAASDKADALAAAKDDRKEMKASGFPYNAHSLNIGWKVEGQTPRYLSLLDEFYTYTGGAHGMTGYVGLLWDKEASKDVAFPTMITGTAPFATVIHDRFCKALDAARVEKRGELVPANAGDEFNRCVDPMQQTLVPTSSTGKALDGLTVVIGPYEAGPYAEGSYEIALPFDAAMIGAIKPDYRGYFAVKR